MAETTIVLDLTALGIAPGLHMLTAEAVDAGGNVGLSDPVGFTVGPAEPPPPEAPGTSHLLHHARYRQVEVIDRYSPKVGPKGGGRARWFGR